MPHKVLLDLYCAHKGPKVDHSKAYVAEFDPISEIKVSKTFFLRRSTDDACTFFLLTEVRNFLIGHVRADHVTTAVCEQIT